MRAQRVRQRRSSAEAEAYWREQVAAYEESGLTQQAFCQERKIAHGTFKQWVQEIRRERREGRPARSAFIPVTVRPDDRGAEKAVSLKVMLPGDIAIVVSEGCQVGLLRQIVKALR